MLASAHASQLIWNLFPCKLCLQQRDIYWAAIAVAALGLVGQRLTQSPRLSLLTCLCLAIVFLVGIGVSGYHVGVEQGLFHAGCTVDTFDPDASLLESLQGSITVGKCDEAVWVVPGILSMAGANVIASLGLLVASLISALRSDRSAMKVD